MKHAQPWVLPVLLLVTVAVRLPDLSMPLERDEGEYAYAAQEMERGGVPYRDTFCQKPPVVFFWYLAGFVAFGETVEGIHLTMLVAAAATAYGLYLLVRRLAPASAAWTAALVYAVASPGAGYFGSAANTEIFMLAPVVFGVLLLVTASEMGGRLRWFGAGGLATVAVLTKQVAVFSFAGPYLCTAWEAGRRGGTKAAAQATVLLAAGAVLACVSILGWLALAGAWDAFLEAAVRHNLDYVGAPFGWRKWQGLYQVFMTRFVPSDVVLWLLMGAGLAALAVPRFRPQPGAAFAGLWFLFSLPGVALGPAGFGHYFLQILPPLAMMAGVRVAQAGTWLGRVTARPGLMTGLLAAAVLAPPLGARLQTLDRSADERSLELYGYYGWPPFLAACEVGRYLRETTRPEDRVLVVGSEPEVLFYARRRSATRYTILYPATGDFPRADAMIDALFAECERQPPAAVVFCYCPTSFSTGGRSMDRVRRIFAGAERIVQAGFGAPTCWDWAGAPLPVDAGVQGGCVFRVLVREK
jgi:4-amino-4-deoxy-L-arabinose transferase-like glycosyltransferase